MEDKKYLNTDELKSLGLEDLEGVAGGTCESVEDYLIEKIHEYKHPGMSKEEFLRLLKKSSESDLHRMGSDMTEVEDLLNEVWDDI